MAGKIYKVRIAKHFITRFLTKGSKWPKTECIEGLEGPVRIISARFDSPSNEAIFYIETEEPVEEGEPIQEFKCVYRSESI